MKKLVLMMLTLFLFINVVGSANKMMGTFSVVIAQ
jgi:hypothetical protein